MKKQSKNITNLDELSKHLKYSSPIIWISLSIVISILLGFFAWSFIYKIKVKITGIADINNGAVTLHVDEAKLNELKEGQKVYISNQEGQILSFNDHQPVVSTFTLDDGEYDYYIVIKEIRPIDFLLK